MSEVYTISGISRQAYHRAAFRAASNAVFWQRLKDVVLAVRKDYPRISARKIHFKLNLAGVVGINKFERFLSEQGLAVKKHRSIIKTTRAGQNTYPNLVNGLRLDGINQLWVSDITYFIASGTVFYIVLILDVYSRRILGYSASDNLLALNNQNALEMCFIVRKECFYHNLVHHSDKGSQFGSKDYLAVLDVAGIKVSMASNCFENPYAERVMGTIKNDFLVNHDISTLLQLKKALARSVRLYNDCPHGELGMKSPLEFEELLGKIPREEHPVMQLYDFSKTREQNIKMGFLRHKTKKIFDKEKTVALQSKTTVINHFHGSAYSLEGCSPAEPSSASADDAKLNKLNQTNKLSFQQLE